ncbi:MAG: response regulator [Polyangiales bacterium]
MDRPLLVADDDQLICSTMSRFFARSRRVVVAKTVREAIAAVNVSPSWSGAIIDYNFPDGDGLSVLEAFRQRTAHAPVLMLTGTHEASVNHRASALGAQFVMKPAPNELLKAFAARLSQRVAPAELQLEVERTAKEFGLSPGESRILGAAVRGVARDDIPEHLGLAESTIKSQVRGLVEKCEVSHLNDVVRLVWERSTQANR